MTIRQSDSTAISPLTRRQFLQQVSGGTAAATMSSLAWPIGATEANRSGFVHRSYNGWITDLATQEDANCQWPSMRLDEQLLADYHQTFRHVQAMKFNEIVIWGLFVAETWPLDITSAVTPERGVLLEQLVSDHAGPAVYLRDRLDAQERAAYGNEITRLATRFARLAPDLTSNRAQLISACLQNVQRDVKRQS